MLTIIVLLTGPAGAGKSTLAQMLCERPGFQRLVSYTTRRKRPLEQDGVDYRFISPEKFIELEANGHIMESLRHKDGTCYGTPFPDWSRNDITWVAVTSSEGIQKFKTILYNRAKIVVILADAPDEELFQRMLKRGDALPEIQKRSALWERERSTASFADLIVGRDSPEVELQKILNAIAERRG